MKQAPEVGGIAKCLVCGHERPWGIFSQITGETVCISCRDRARSGDDGIDWRDALDEYARRTAAERTEALRTIAALESQAAALREALEKSRDLFTDIRGDWSDPRSRCRQGWAIIDAALATDAGAAVARIVAAAEMVADDWRAGGASAVTVGNMDALIAAIDARREKA